MFTLLNYRLTTRIAAAFGLIALLFLVQAGTSLLLLNHMQDNAAAQIAELSKGGAGMAALAAITTQARWTLGIMVAVTLVLVGVLALMTERGIRIHRRGEDGATRILTPQLNDAVQPDDVIVVREALF